MRDQATPLRTLVLDTHRLPAFSAGGAAPPMLAILGGRPSTGATMLTANLAAALAEQGHRVVAIDADPQHPRLAEYCGVTADHGIQELLAGKNNIHELLRRGPSGVQVLPGSKRPVTEVIHYPSVLRQLVALGRHADVVLLDLGSNTRRGLIELWREYSEVMLVTTPDPQAILDGYAALKLCLPATRRHVVALTLNHSASAQAAQEIGARLDRSARTFLDVGVRLYGTVPTDPAISISSAAGAPLVLRHPTHAAAVSMQKIAADLAQRWLETAAPHQAAA